MEFFEAFASGSVGFDRIGAEIARVWGLLTAEGGTIANLWGTVMGWISTYLPFAWILPTILATLSLLQIFCGRKLLGLQKFLVCLGIGFACGAVLIHPLLLQIGISFMPDWVVGLIVGIVAAILARLFYVLAYILAAGGAGYILCMSGILPESISSFVGVWYIALAVAVVFVILALVFRGALEMLGTAALGGYTLYLSFLSILASFGWGIGESYEIWWMIGFLAVSTILGFIVQFKTRRKD
jgi:hypothetical protein